MTQMPRGRKEPLINSKQGPLSMENGLEGSEMASEYSNGQMVPGMKDCGKIIELMEKASSLILMETFMMANGSTTKLMDMEYITI